MAINKMISVRGPGLFRFGTIRNSAIA
jgi:hypothetical protein